MKSGIQLQCRYTCHCSRKQACKNGKYISQIIHAQKNVHVSSNLPISPICTLSCKICQFANWPDWQIGRNMYIVFPLISREYWLKEGTQTKASHCLNFTGSNPDLHSQSNTQIGGISGYTIINRQKHIVYEV